MSTYKFFSGLLGMLFRTNILDGGGYSGMYGPFAPPNRIYKTKYAATTGYPGLLYNQQTVEQYLAIMDMLTEIYMFSIAGVTTRYISDVILEGLREKISISVNSTDQKFNEKASMYLEDYFNEIKIKDLITKILPDIVYYGSYSFLLDENNELQNLYDPHCVINIIGSDYKEVGYLINAPTEMHVMPIDEIKIIKIGSDELLLYSNVFNIEESRNEEENRKSIRLRNYSKVKNKFLDKEKSYIRKYSFIASQPLFYYTRMQLREYVLKQVVLALTTLRDLLFPLVYTLQYEYSSISYTVENLADRIEDILNEYVDVSGFIGVKGDLTRVLNMITYSIRVLPDFKGSIANLTPLDTTKLTEKLDKYKDDLNTVYEQIMEDLGIPVKERTTYWENIKQNERFATKINTISTAIDLSLSNLGKILLKKKFANFKDKYEVNVSLFGLSYGKIARMQNAVESLSTYIESSFGALDSFIENITGEKAHIYNPEGTIEFVKSHLRHLFPNVDQMINWEIISKNMKLAAKQALAEMEDMGDNEEERGLEAKSAAVVGSEKEEKEAAEEKEEEGGGGASLFG